MRTHQANSLISLVNNRIKKRQVEVAVELVGGAPTSGERACRAQGHYAGLAEAMAIIEAVWRDLEGGEDDDE